MDRFRICLSLVRGGMDPITAFNKSHTNSYGKYIRTRASPNAALQILRVRDEFRAWSDLFVALGEQPVFQ